MMILVLKPPYFLGISQPRLMTPGAPCLRPTSKRAAGGCHDHGLPQSRARQRCAWSWIGTLIKGDLELILYTVHVCYIHIHSLYEFV